MYLTRQEVGGENQGLGLIEIFLRYMKEKQAKAAQDAQTQVDKNVDAMTNVATKMQTAEEIDAAIKKSQQNALQDLLDNFYGLPWEQVGIIAAAGLVSLYLLFRD